MAQEIMPKALEGEIVADLALTGLETPEEIYDMLERLHSVLLKPAEVA